MNTHANAKTPSRAQNLASPCTKAAPVASASDIHSTKRMNLTQTTSLCVGLGGNRVATLLLHPLVQLSLQAVARYDLVQPACMEKSSIVDKSQITHHLRLVTMCDQMYQRSRNQAMVGPHGLRIEVQSTSVP